MSVANQDLEKFIADSYAQFAKEQKIDLELSAAHINKLLLFLDLLQRWNQKMDLVSPASLEVLAERHVLDSAFAWALISRLGVAGDGSFVDIGSGAGLPGLVLGIFSPERDIVLCEPRDKRAAFLREARRVLELPNIKVEQLRVEELGAEQNMSLIITRATALRKECMKLSESGLMPGGLFVEMRGGELSEKIADSDSASHRMVQQSELSYFLPNSAIKHRLLVWKCFT